MSNEFPIEDTLQEISEQLSFFQQGKLLAFEEEKMLRPENNQVCRPDLQIKDKSMHKYDDQHPKFKGMANSSISNLFRNTKSVKINDCNLFDFPADDNQSFFISLYYNKQNGWLVNSSNHSFLYFGDSKTIQEFNKPKLTFFNGKSLQINSSNIYYPLKIHSIGVQSQKSEIQSLGQFIQHVSSTKSSIPFENFIMSFKKCGSYPPVTLETAHFYSQIVEDPRFLFLITNLTSMQNEITNNYIAWTQTCGHFLRSLYPIIAFKYFNSITSESELFQKNNFILNFSASIYKNDPAFSLFCEAFDPPSEKVVDYFLSSLSSLHFSNLSQFVTITLYEESKRIFPDMNGPILVLTRIIFQTAFATLVLNRNSKYLPEIDQILTFCSFTASDKQLHNYFQLQIQRILQECLNKKEAVYFTKCGFTPLSYIHTLLQHSFTDVDELLNILNEIDLNEIIDEFKQKLSL